MMSIRLIINYFHLFSKIIDYNCLKTVFLLVILAFQTSKSWKIKDFALNAENL